MIAAELSLGEVVAWNIAAGMERQGWDFEQLAEASGLGWSVVVGYRADAGAMSVVELSSVATALGVTAADLMRVPESDDTLSAADRFRLGMDAMRYLYAEMSEADRTQADKTLGVTWRMIRESVHLEDIEEGDFIEVIQAGIRHQLTIGTVNGLELIPAGDGFECLEIGSHDPAEIWRLEPAGGPS